MGEVTRFPFRCGVIGPNRSGGMPGLSPIPFPQCTLHFPLCVSLGDVVPAVVLPFAFCHRQLDFHFPTLEIEFQRNKGKTAFLHSTPEAVYFVFVKQELSPARRLVIVLISLLVFINVQVVKEGFILLHTGITVFKIGSAQPQGFYLSALELDSRLIAVEYGVVVPRLAVLDNRLGSVGHGFSTGGQVTAK